MKNLKEYTCCFIGHRNITQTDALEEKLYNEIEILIIKERVCIFLFGSKSQFDDLCYNVVSKLKEKYPYIKRVYVRAAYADIDTSYVNYLLTYYEDTYYPEKIRNAGRASYIERNYEMINNSEFCVVYYDKNYIPPIRTGSKSKLARDQPKSGTAAAYDYAIRKKKKVINICRATDKI